MGTEMDEDRQLLQTFSNALFSDLDSSAEYWNEKPLLAHYTSVPVLEAILRNDELWFSNPLFMNDIEEIRFGFNEGVKLFLTSQEIEKACKKPSLEILRERFSEYCAQFSNDHVLDTYVFCLSEHKRENLDGILSMWRGYGGNGNGAAIVIDASKIPSSIDSPLIIAKVHYKSYDERLEWIKQRITQFAQLLATYNLPDEKLHVAALAFFHRLKLAAIFSKHSGFDEEKEWRVVYMKDRDNEKHLEHMLDYSIGSRGVEPKLKLKITEFLDKIGIKFSLEDATHSIILGPSISSPIQKMMIGKMLDRIKKPGLKERVISSTIPFRPL